MRKGPRGTDPISAFSRLEERLRCGSFPACALIAAASRGGTEPFFGEEAIRLLKGRADREEGCEVFLHDGEAEEFRLSVICMDLRSPPLFGRTKILVIRRADPLCRKGSPGEGDATPFEKAVLHFLNEPNSRGALLACFDRLDPEAPLFAAAGDAGAFVLEARKLYASPPPWMEGAFAGPTELERWIEERARAKKISLPAGEKLRIAERCGSDLFRVEREIEAVPAAPRRGSSEASTAGRRRLGEPSPKALLRVFFRGELAGALEILDRMFREGLAGWGGERITQPAALFPILCSVFRQEVLTWLEARPDSEDLHRLLRGLLRLEREVKGGKASDPRLALERFLVSCSPRPAEPAR